MNVIFPLLIVISVLFGLMTGNMSTVSKAAIESAQEAIKLSFSVMGTLCLWSGVMKTAQAAGAVDLLARLFSPALQFIFSRKLPHTAMTAIASNVSANLLGLGNAATPLGLTAMKELQKLNTGPDDTASDETVLFTVINTSALQLIPTTVSGLRTACGSAAPMEILPAVWAVSLISLITSVAAAKILCRFFK